MYGNAGGERSRNWLVGEFEQFINRSDAEATAAALGGLIADCPEVIEAIQAELDKPVSPVGFPTDDVAGNIVRRVVALCGQGL